jgi:hypothetical protein
MTIIMGIKERVRQVIVLHLADKFNPYIVQAYVAYQSTETC